MSRLEKLGFTPEALRNAEVVELEPAKPKLGKKEKMQEKSCQSNGRERLQRFLFHRSDIWKENFIRPIFMP